MLAVTDFFIQNFDQARLTNEVTDLGVSLAGNVLKPRNNLIQVDDLFFIGQVDLPDFVHEKIDGLFLSQLPGTFFTKVSEQNENLDDFDLLVQIQIPLLDYLTQSSFKLHLMDFKVKFDILRVLVKQTYELFDAFLLQIVLLRIEDVQKIHALQAVDHFFSGLVPHIIDEFISDAQSEPFPLIKGL